MESLWPDDIVAADARSPAAILKEQASLLGQQTENLVTAEERSEELEGEAVAQPKSRKRTKRIDVLVIAKEGHSALVQWLENDESLRRGFVDIEAIQNGKCDEAALDAAQPYGVPWEEILSDMEPVTPQIIADSLRTHGIWTSQDIEADMPRAIRATTRPLMGLAADLHGKSRDKIAVKIHPAFNYIGISQHRLKFIFHIRNIRVSSGVNRDTAHGISFHSEKFLRRLQTYYRHISVIIISSGSKTADNLKLSLLHIYR